MLSPSIRTSPTYLLNQTHSFGAIRDGDPTGGGGERPQNGATHDAKPQGAVRASSLDDILGTKVRTTAAGEALVASAASGAAAGAPSPRNRNESAPGAAAEGGTRDGSFAATAPKKKRGSLDDILGIKVGKAVRGSTMKILQEGDAVEILTTPLGGGPSAFSPGVINRVHADGSVDVALNTGARLVQRPPKEVRMVRKGRTSAAGLAPGDLAVGDRVEAR